MVRALRALGCRAASGSFRGGRERPPYNPPQMGAGKRNVGRKGKVPGFACRLPCFVGRAISPAGQHSDGRKVCGTMPSIGPETLRRPETLAAGVNARPTICREQVPRPGTGAKKAVLAAERCFSSRPPFVLQGGQSRPPDSIATAERFAGRCGHCCPVRVKAWQGAAPLRRLRRHLPLQGRLCKRQPPKGSPVRGAGIAPAMTEGCIAPLFCKYPAGS